MKRVLLVFAVAIVSCAWTTPVVDLVNTIILDNKVEVLLSKEFQLMSEDLLKAKYPSARRPTLVYTDETGKINLAFNHTSSKASQQQVEVYQQNFVSTYKSLYPSAEWKSNGVKQVNGR